MKRRNFILMTAVVAVGFVTPVYLTHKKYARIYQPLLFPESLTKLFDKEAIREIGIAYRLKMNDENDRAKLKQLLLTDGRGRLHNEEDKFKVREMLNKETKVDFEKGRIVVVNGWVLSQTEARQCALYSFSDD